MVLYLEAVASPGTVQESLIVTWLPLTVTEGAPPGKALLTFEAHDRQGV
jgi:hypothetical protein